MPSRTIFFATSNLNKLRELKHFLDSGGLAGYKLEQVDSDFIEPQLETMEEIAKAKAEAISRKLNKPVIADDTGLEIGALKGFPGPYSKWIFYKIGNDGVLKLLDGKGTPNNRNRKAKFKSAIALSIPGKDTKTFVGTIEGTIAPEVRGKENQNGHWGYDPIFIPNGSNKTWAEDYNSKLKDNHRTRSLAKLVEYLKKEQKK